MISPEKLQRIEQWNNKIINIKPDIPAYIGIKELIDSVKADIVIKETNNKDITNAIELIDKIKVGNTLSYEAHKSCAIGLLQNVLNRSK